MPPGEVNLWLVDLAQIQDSELQQFRRRVTPHELEYSQRLSEDKMQARDVVGRGILRSILSSYLDFDPLTIPLSRSAQGKPQFDNLQHPQREFDTSGVSFNYSHSGDFIVYAFCRWADTPVDIGVDVEHCLRRNALQKIAKRYFTVAEVAALDALPELEKADYFFQLWTLKEAYLKARGEGIYLGLGNIDFSLAALNSQRIEVRFSDTVFDDPSRWQFMSLLPKPAYRVSVALSNAPTPLSLKYSCTQVADWL